MAQSKKPNATSSSPRRWYEPHTALGCLWRSLVVTLVFFVLYIVIGWLIAG